MGVGFLGLCPARLAPGSAAFPWGFCLSQALDPSYQRLVEVQDPGPGNTYVSAYPWPGAPALGAGACSPPWACLPHYSVAPRPVREGRLALTDLTLAWSPALLVARTSGTLWTCVLHPPASHATSCASSPVWPALVYSFCEHLLTPHPSVCRASLLPT